MLRTFLITLLSALLTVVPAKNSTTTTVIELPTEEEILIDDSYDEYAYGSQDEAHVVCAIDAVNASCGFLVPPTKVEYDENKNCAEIFVDILSEYGYSAEYTGTTEDKFYLSSVSGIDTSNAAIPKSLRGFLSLNKVTINDSLGEAGVLGEFDFTGSSGWVYTVNGEMPSVAMSEYYPEENDVIRLRYSLCFGVDTGNYPEWGFDYSGIDIQNTDEIVRTIAEYGAEHCQAALDELSYFDADVDSIYRLLPVN